MNVRLTHIDGKLPNLALMKLAHWHRARGDSVTHTRALSRGLFEPTYERVYGSSIFAFSRNRLDTFLGQWPEAVVGGTGTESVQTVEQAIGEDEYEHYDYSTYPDFMGSIGFTARGCRLRCGFCVVPMKEGKPRAVNTIAELWRGEPYPKHLHLLDNDFFGQPPEQWQARIAEILAGKFRVCFNQGINIRLITEEAAEQIARLPYYDEVAQVQEVRGTGGTERTPGAPREARRVSRERRWSLLALLWIAVMFELGVLATEAVSQEEKRQCWRLLGYAQTARDTLFVLTQRGQCLRAIP